MIARTYQTWEQFFEDVELMCNNATLYNEDESEVYRDALQIKVNLSRTRSDWDSADPLQGSLEWHRNEVKNRSAQPYVPKVRVKASTITPVRTSSNLRPPSQSVEPQRPTAFPTPPSAYNSSQQPQQPVTPAGPSSSSAHYLPALPTGVVTEDVVHSLDQYPIYEQQAWANSLPPLAMQIYRQMAAKKSNGTSAIPPQPAILADLPSTAQPNGQPSFPDRHAPPLPAIKCIDFAFSSSGEGPAYRQAIRLHNMRGVVTHAVVVGAETSEIELTAYIADAPTTEALNPPGEVPELSLRVNGNQGSLPKFVYQSESKDRPAGMRWTITVPTSRVETKIEVVATKPGALAETSAIFINRQY